MNGMMIFRNAEFGTIRTMSNPQGEPVFCAKDVAEALGYKNTRDSLKRHVDDDDVVKHDTIDRLGRTQQAIFINESGLYALILSSKLDSAKRFKRWVTGEVLPAIRKQGGYMLAKKGESEKEIMKRALQIVQATLARRDEQIAQLQPRADYADHVLDSINCITTTQLAKELSMTAQQLNRRLCEMHIQYWQSGQYMLYADYARQGFAKSRTRVHTVRDGIVLTETYLVWTERGREFIHRLLNPKFAN
ncbi:MAG: phage antirepressor KilAC domain-containing protein [Bacteroidaceae bacterium]|nr:phage antirepressor KilAC domain-containing protein [Bacteroidaceae bacterium]